MLERITYDDLLQTSSSDDSHSKTFQHFNKFFYRKKMLKSKKEIWKTNSCSSVIFFFTDTMIRSYLYTSTWVVWKLLHLPLIQRLVVQVWSDLCRNGYVVLSEAGEGKLARYGADHVTDWRAVRIRKVHSLTCLWVPLWHNRTTFFCYYLNQ